MADEKRQLILDLLARNKMGGETSAAARDVDKLGTAADKAGKKTEEMSGVTVIAGKETEKLGRSAEDTKRRIDDLDEEIRKSTKELGELAIAFHEAGSQADKLDVSKAIRRTESDIRRTTKSKGILAGLLPGDSETSGEGQKIGKNLAQSIRDGLTLSRGYVIGAAVAIGVALAPELGSAVGGAIVGGVGAGGIIGGIALAASSDQQIKGYASRIGKTFLTNIQAEARDSFSTFIMEDLGKVEALSNRAATALGKIFKNVAPELGPFVDNLIRAADVLLGSFVSASSKAGKPLNSLGNFIENVAIHLGHLIDVSTKYSDEGASALDFFGSAVTHVIDLLTFFVAGASEALKAIHEFGGAVGDARNWLEDHVGWLDLTADGYAKGSKAAELYRQGLIGAKDSATDYDHYLAGAVDSTNTLSTAQSNEMKASRGQRDALKAVSDELRAQSDPAFALLSAQDNLRTKQDALTEAIKKYGSKSKEAGAASRDLATAAIDLQGAAGSLSGNFDGELTPAMLATLEAAKLTKGQIAEVRRQFQLAKGAGDAYAKTYRAKVITDYINRYSDVVTSAADKAYQDTKKSLKKRASGGPVARGEPYIVGENGPEVWVPTAAGRVLSAAASRGVARVGGPSRGGGSGDQVVRLELVGEDRIRTLFRYMIRSMNLLQEDPA
jgi:hypothetical protein